MFNFFRRKKKKKTARRGTSKNTNIVVKESSPVVMQGVITAGILNVRNNTSKTANIVGKLSKNTIVSIFDNTISDWYQIKFNDKYGYISSRYVKALTGKVNAKVLNVRKFASLNADKVGQLKKGDNVEVIQRLKSWYLIKFGNGQAYISSKFIKLNIDNAASTEVNKVVDLLKNNTSILAAKVNAATKIKVPKQPRESRITAQTYNKYGGMLEVLCNKINIDIATAVAVLAVESAGHGYGAEGNVIIRFENHLFHRFWGKENERVYNRHFKYSKTKSWDGHLFRKDKKDDWKAFHGNQKNEWEVFEFARKLDNKAALKSASYGAPQILGTNFKKIGYINTEDMLFYFNKDIKYQLLALFDFFNPAMIKHLQQKEFTEFARYYNGRGQATRYGGFIKKHYDAFKKLNV